MSRIHHKGGEPSQRMLRVAELIRHAVAQLLARGEINDPDLAGLVVTVPSVKMSPDLKLATVYVMPLGGKARMRSSPFSTATRNICAPRSPAQVNLKYAPEIRFRVDESFDQRREDRRLAAKRPRWRRISRARADGPRTTLKATGRRRRAVNAPRSTRVEVNGWVILDKPVGLTSTQAVSKLKRLFNAKKAGHAGRSTRSPRACCRSRSARRPRPCPSSRTARRPIASPCNGASRPTPTTPRATRSRPATRVPTRRHRGPAAAVHRRDHAAPAGLFGHQDQRRARL